MSMIISSGSRRWKTVPAGATRRMGQTIPTRPSALMIPYAGKYPMAHEATSRSENIGTPEQILRQDYCPIEVSHTVIDG